ncbi:MAG TPA: T9SS type A sorting domain-containing protein [Ignavibacteria bacterium]|nr:T9SS type A sorting domain-containing protein [Ignavibacteria bacterium]
MRLLIYAFLFAFIMSYSISAQLRYVQAFPNLSFNAPVDIQNAGDATDRLFVLEQEGKIRVFQNDSLTATSEVFLDLINKVLFGGEQGLLGLAFHPNYKENGFFYINYTTSNPRRTVVSRFSVSQNNPNQADPNSEFILLEVGQPYSNHNGGQTSFGPDGYLYISLGDGGSGGDPLNNGQDRTTLLGNILRIDVDNPDPGLNYGIPDDNPFVGNTAGWREEIYAYGLRNVWRFSFDPVTNKLWAADVGQNAYEEINIIEKGKNYGWRIMEGFHCYNPPTNCDQTGLELPVWEYAHNDPNGGQSITGGFVYRGNNASELYGGYVYGDFVTGRIWVYFHSENPTNMLIFNNTRLAISTFGVDENNELYFASYGNGRIYKFIGKPTSVDDEGKLKINYQLYQNYPNPFNPDTVISFYLSKPEVVKLEIYDGLGKLVEEIFYGTAEIGLNKFVWSGKNYASGVYYFKLTSQNFSDTKKMVLMR